MCSGTIPSEQPLTYHTESYESYLSFFFRGQSTFVHLSLADMSSLWRTRVICMGLLLTTSSCPTSNTLEIPPWIYGCWIHLLAFIKFKTIIKDIKNDWRTLKVSKVCDSPHSSMDTSFTTRFASSICHLPGSARPLVEEILHWFSQSASTPEPPGIAIAAATDAVGHCRTTTGASGWPKSRSHCRSSAICPSSLRESS